MDILCRWQSTQLDQSGALGGRPSLWRAEYGVLPRVARPRLVLLSTGRAGLVDFDPVQCVTVGRGGYLLTETKVCTSSVCYRWPCCWAAVMLDRRLLRPRRGGADCSLLRSLFSAGGVARPADHRDHPEAIARCAAPAASTITAPATPVAFVWFYLHLLMPI